ncbi:Ig-like domain-containing protein [uncultured Winogradskyella sp.]|uniref:Ig-like domain-containing protein n=1 Tax=uncultured Winogradskyella sp. TaxID=395353 RepID=UPI00351299B9
MKAPNLKFTKTILGILLLILSQQIIGQIPAFPGAEGFGKYTVGGRGGQVYFVEHLKDHHIVSQWRDDSEPSGQRVKDFTNTAGDNLPDIWKQSVGLDINTFYNLYDSDVPGETKLNIELCQEQINDVLVASTGDNNDYAYFEPDLNSPYYDGSFRKACLSTGPRTVIFRVGGRLELFSPINISNPNITIAGQTAPGDGIMLTGELAQPSRLLQISTNQVIVRFITLRRSQSSTGYNAGDCLYISNGENIIIDHVSSSWSSDGNIDIANYDRNLNNRGTDNVTVQYCLMTNSYGGSNKSMLITGDPPNVSLFRNAFINSNSRNPALSSDAGYNYTYDGNYELVNNLWFDCLNGATCGNVSQTNKYNVNFVNNWRKAANGGTHSRRMLRIGNGSATDRERAYVSGNLAHSLIDSGIENDPEWRMVQYGAGMGNANNIVPASMRSDTPFDTPILSEGVPIWSGADVRNNLLNVVGNYIQGRDAEDQRAINDVLNETSSYNNATNTFPVYNGGTPLPDTDNDGMADSWEIDQFGDLSSDGVIDTDGDGYTDLEEYLNQTANDGIDDVPAQSVEVNPAEATVNIPDAIELEAIFTPAYTTNQSGEWTSSDESIATVDATGLVTPVSEGVAIITFTSNDGNFSDSSTITVTNEVIAAESLVLNPNQLVLGIGQTETVEVIFTPSNTTNQDGVWSSENPSVADVNENGVITGVSEGVTSISFTSEDGSLTDSVEVTVEDILYGTYELYNADTDALIQLVEGGESFDLAIIGNQINLRSIPRNGDDNPEVESVNVSWVGPNSGSYTESTPLYAGMAEHVGSDFLPYTVQEGVYEFTITYFNQDNAQGNVVAIDNFTLTFFLGNGVIANAGNDVSICEGEAVTLTATGGTSYLWSTGETTSSITVSPNTTTTYSVTVSNNSGDTDSDEVIVTVNPIPVPQVTENQTICSGESVTLTASGGDIYLWSSGETSASITVSPTEDTEYTVEVISNGCSSTANTTVTVNESPQLSVSNDITIVTGDSVTLTASGADNYEWNTGDLASSITVSPSETTTYLVTGFIGNCSATAEVTVSVEEVFVASAGEDQRICQNSGSNVELTASAGDSYLWNTGETTQTIYVSPLSTTTYSVTVTSGIQQFSDEVMVFVDPNPNVVISNGDSVDILDGDFITLSASGANSYEWSNGATQPNIAVSPSQTTTYEVRGYINDCYDEKQVTVNVYPEVVANAGEDQAVCVGESVVLTATGGDDYLWSNGETTASIEVAPNVTTDYTVTVFNAMDFDEDTVRVEVSPCDVNAELPGDDVSNASFSLDIFPNPAQNIVNVRINGAVQATNIQIFDVMGKMVISRQIENTNLSPSLTREININNLLSGIYFVKMNYGDNEIVKKLIVQ